MRYLVFSDIHSYYPYLEQALDAAKYDPASDTLISCGDLMDRGPYPLQCLKFVNEHISANNIICVAGNHEDLIEEAIHRKEFLRHDLSNGTAQTVFDIYDAYKNADQIGYTDAACDFVKDFDLYKNYHSSLVDFYETDKFIFVHGWIPCISSDPNQYHSQNVDYTFDPDWRTSDWYASRWRNGMDCWSQGIYVPRKTIVCGHWHSSWGHHYLHGEGPEFNNRYSTNPEHNNGAHFEPFIDSGIIAIDACTAYSKQVNILIINEDNSTEYVTNKEISK